MNMVANIFIYRIYHSMTIVYTRRCLRKWEDGGNVDSGGISVSVSISQSAALWSWFVFTRFNAVAGAVRTSNAYHNLVV